jgi:hypothetical protein
LGEREINRQNEKEKRERRSEWRHRKRSKGVTVI